VGAGPVGGIDLLEIGIDEGADFDLGGTKLGNDFLEALDVGRDIQTALGRDFFTAFGNETDFLGLEAQRLLRHGRSGGHLEVERNADGAQKLAHVGLLDMTAIFAQMHGNGVGPSAFGEVRGFENIGFRRESDLPSAITGLAQRGDVIDV
jgi:hypothetical protein